MNVGGFYVGVMDGFINVEQEDFCGFGEPLGWQIN